MSDQAERATRFLVLHQGDAPLLLPNPWDRGSARLLASMGFAALATTSSGFAATLGRLDGSVSREEAVAHAAEIVEATELPVSADLENAFADDVAGVTRTFELIRHAGVAGASIEDSSGCRCADLRARARGGARRGGRRGRSCRSGPSGADRPRAELPARAFRGVPSVTELAAVGVARVSVGGAFAFAAIAALVDAAQELQREGSYGFLMPAHAGVQSARAAFGD